MIDLQFRFDAVEEAIAILAHRRDASKGRRIADAACREDVVSTSAARYGDKGLSHILYNLKSFSWG